MDGVLSSVIPDESYEPEKVEVPDQEKGFLVKFFAYAGPGFLSSIAYLDPGNFSACLDLGTFAGYRLLWALFFASIISFFFQILASRIGVVTSYGLARLIRLSFPVWMSRSLWVMVELAIIVTDIQAVIGSSIGLTLLFNIPLWVGCLLTAFDTFFVLLIFSTGVRLLESVFLFFVGVMALCFIIQFASCDPDMGEVGKGLFIPSFKNNDVHLIIAVLGATVMTHNLFLHSQVVQTRKIDRSNESKVDEALLFSAIDFGSAIFVALIINIAVVVVFAAKFYPAHGIGLENAGQALENELGQYARYLWGIGILAAGQASTMTGTYTGQIVTEGFLDIEISPVLRAILTRCISLVPALFISVFFSEQDLNDFNGILNILQSFVLPVALIPILRFSASNSVMGSFALEKFGMTMSIILTFVVVGANFSSLIFFFSTSTKTDEHIVLITVASVLSIGYFYLIYHMLTEPLQFKISDLSEEAVLITGRMKSNRNDSVAE